MKGNQPIRLINMGEGEKDVDVALMIDTEIGEIGSRARTRVEMMT